MTEPLFWLGLSILLVAVSLAAVLIALLPVLQEITRTARSIEKLADTLNRELPPTLEAIRLTGLEISDLTDDISEGVQSAGRVVKQVDQGLSGARKQVKEARMTTRSVFAGVKAAWRSWARPTERRRDLRAGGRSSLREGTSTGGERVTMSERISIDLRSTYQEYQEHSPANPSLDLDSANSLSTETAAETPEGNAEQI